MNLTVEEMRRINVLRIQQYHFKRLQNISRISSANLKRNGNGVSYTISIFLMLFPILLQPLFSKEKCNIGEIEELLGFLLIYQMKLLMEQLDQIINKSYPWIKKNQIILYWILELVVIHFQDFIQTRWIYGPKISM